jgi:hypothetical protein
MEPGPAGPPVHRRARQADLLPDLRPRRHARQHAGECRGHTVDHRVLLRSRQKRGWPGPVRGPYLDRVAPTRHPRHAGPGLLDRRASGGHRGVGRPSISKPTFCRSPSRKSAPCSPVSSACRLRIPPPLSPGHSGDDVINSGPGAATGSDALKPIGTGCSIRRGLGVPTGRGRGCRRPSRLPVRRG